MNDQLNPKERELKELLENASFELDTSALWDSIEHRIPQQKNKKRFVIWWWALGLFLLIGIGFLGIIDWDNISENNTNSAEAPKELHAEVLKVSDPLNENTRPSNTIESSHKESIVAESKNQSSDESNTKEVDFKIAQQTIISIEESVISVNDQEAILRNSSTISLEKNVVFNEQESVEDVKPSSLIEPTLLAEAKKRLGFMSTSLLRNIDGELTYDRDPVSLIYSLAPIAAIKPVNENSWLGFISFGIGTNKSFSNHTNINSTGEFRPELFEKEIGQWGLGSELMYNLENKNAWSIGLGVAYDLNVSRYFDLGEQTTQSTSTGNVEIDIDADGTVTPLVGQLTQTTINNADVQWYRQHQNVDAHLRIARKLWSANRWSIDLEGGLLYNIYSKSSGYYFEDTANGFVKFDASEENPYKKNQGFKAQLGMLVAYSFDKVDLGLRTYYRYNPNSILEKNHFYELKNSQLGFQISVAYRPNWK